MNKELWIIGSCCSADDGVDFSKVNATEAEVKELLLNKVMTDRAEDKDIFEHVTDNCEEMEEKLGGIYAYNCFIDYHIDYSAIRLSQIEELEV